MKRARWWMRRRWHPQTFAEYMALPQNIARRDAMVASCDAFLARDFEEARRQLERARALRPDDAVG